MSLCLDHLHPTRTNWLLALLLVVRTIHGGKTRKWWEDEEVENEEGDIVVEEGENGVAVKLFDAFKTRLNKPWENAVIVKLLGKSIGYRTLLLKIQTLWKPSSPFRIVDLDNNFFIIRFQSQADYYHALIDGPWVIFGSVLSVQPWSPDFNPAKDSVDKVVCWVRFPGLSPTRYHTKVLTTMGNVVGSTVKIDTMTEKAKRGKFAKLAVAVDLTQPLKGVVRLDEKDIQVSYEGLPTICFTCGRIDHSPLVCPMRSRALGKEQQLSEGQESVDTPSPG
ncbi:hypothetical protein Tsubulata_042945 [Turnera subulata]|uniref:DUF4283 domain-containing protein n=1 Tax=Turnera subulata TaxID=218843 RepID=A0A9Q0J324_9ROSI|nr:hypothetical protein Tsubulata_042945 [Turnera subulata]